MKKFLSLLIGVAVLFTSVVANAAISVENFDGEDYYMISPVETAEQVSARTPRLTMVSTEQILLSQATAEGGISVGTGPSKKTDANTDFYKVTYKVDNLGDLYYAFSDELYAYHAVKLFTVSVSLPGLTAKEGKSSSTFAGSTWSTSKNNAQLVIGTGSDTTYPVDLPETGGVVSNTEIDFVIYYAVAKGTEYNAAPTLNVTYSQWDATFDEGAGDYVLDTNGRDAVGVAANNVVFPPATTTYDIAFKTYDGASDIQANTYNDGDTVTAPTAPARPGYTFSHWSETQGGAAATVLTTATAGKTYYAVYTQDNYTIKFVDEDGTTDVIAPVTNAHYGDAITAPASNPTKPGKTFAGWSPAVPATVTGSQTFTATYTQDNYTITFYDEDGETVIGTPVTNAHYGDAISAPTAPAKAGKTFTGWSPAVPATVTGTASFTATYGDASYTVAFKTFDGASNIQSASYKYGDAVAVPGKDIVPARAGYVFAGWAEKENGALSDRVTPATTATADATYYAVYVAIPAQTSATNVGVAALRGTELTKLDDSAAGTADADYYGGKVEFNPNTEFFGYRVLLKGHVIGSEEIVEKECDPIVFGTEGDVELSAGSTASFTVLVKTKARVITDIIIKAFEK